MTTGALDIEAGIKLGARSYYMRATCGPVVSKELHIELSSELGDAHIFKMLCNEKIKPQPRSGIFHERSTQQELERTNRTNTTPYDTKANSAG